MSGSKSLQRLLDHRGPLLVIDLEATCSGDDAVPKGEMEIIEIGAVLLGQGLLAEDEFNAFVRPVRHPQLTDYCRELTGISQGDVDGALPFPGVMASFSCWVEKTGAQLWTSWGMFDRIQFERDFALHGLQSSLPPRHANLREAWGKSVGPPNPDFLEALGRAGITFEGRQHRGIDDARNIARLIPHVLRCAGKA